MRFPLRFIPLWLVFFALLLAVYSPALRGGILWDDARHITAPQLRSLEGLWRIWFEIGATQQYYPLLHSAFWAQWWCWGGKTTGYHLVNVALHALNAALLFGVASRAFNVQTSKLKVGSAAPLAAAIWAFHPVMVESVAWITELKNTLSTAFYLGAMLAFLRWQGNPPAEPGAGGRGGYALSLALFVCALLSKTVTATLPGALLVIGWWRSGRIGWRQVKPTLPMWLLGAAGGLLTAWVERKFVGAEGADYGLNLIERILLAGRVVWFYAGKLFWPAELMFVYPKWEIDARQGWQWLGVIGGILLVGAVWFARPFGAAAKRGFPAAAMLFVGSLLPVLGFFNVYPFVYSYVADHFQYLASMAVIAAAATILSRWKASWVIVPALAVLSWREAGQYADAATLWRRTLEGNPGCGMAHNHYGAMLLARGRAQEALIHLKAALDLKGDDDLALGNLAAYHAQRGEYPQAVDCQRRAAEALDRQPSRESLRARRATHHFRVAQLQLAWAAQAPALAPQLLAQAIAELKLALWIDPDNRMYQQYLESATQSK